MSLSCPTHTSHSAKWNKERVSEKKKKGIKSIWKNICKVSLFMSNFSCVPEKVTASFKTFIHQGRRTHTSQHLWCLHSHMKDFVLKLKPYIEGICESWYRLPFGIAKQILHLSFLLTPEQNLLIFLDYKKAVAFIYHYGSVFE